ncbi:MAG: hypothetical protein VCE91_14175 [Nitrospinota bacterium]
MPFGLDEKSTARVLLDQAFRCVESAVRARIGAQFPGFYAVNSVRDRDMVLARNPGYESGPLLHEWIAFGFAGRVDFWDLHLGTVVDETAAGVLFQVGTHSGVSNWGETGPLMQAVDWKKETRLELTYRDMSRLGEHQFNTAPRPFEAGRIGACIQAIADDVCALYPVFSREVAEKLG